MRRPSAGVGGAGGAGRGARLGRRTAVGGVVLEPGNLHLAGRERPLEHRPGRMHGDRRHLGPEVARQVRGRHRRQHRPLGAVARQRRAPLQIPRVRAADRLALGVRVGLRPRAPGFVRRGGVARSRDDLHLAGAPGGAPADRAPARDRAGVAHVRLVGAFARRRRRQREHLAGIAGGADDAAGRLAQERRDLPRGGAGEQRRARRIAATAGKSCLPCRCRPAGCRRPRRSGRRAHRLPSPRPCPTGRRAGCGRSRRGRDGAWSGRRTARCSRRLAPSTTVMPVISVETDGT